MKELLILLQSRSKTVFIVSSSVLLILIVAWISRITIPYTTLIGIIFLTCLLNGIFLIFIRQKLWLEPIKSIQPVINILMITIGIHYTGGIESIFVYLYLMVIIGESIRTGIKRGYVFAALSLLCYGIVIALEFANIIPHIHTSNFFATDAFKNIPFFMLACTAIIAFLVAFLSGYLSMIVRVIIKMKDDELTLATQNILTTTNLLQAIFDNMNDGVISAGYIDDNLLVLSANTAMKGLLHLQEEDMVNKPLNQILMEPPLINAIENAMKRGTPISYQMNILSKERETLFLLVKITPLPEVLPLRVVMVFQDISIEKRFSATKATLLSNLSHELRTPLTSIKAYTEILLEEETKEKNKEFLQIVYDESNRLNDLIDNFINFAKMELKTLNLKKESIVVSRLIDELIPSCSGKTGLSPTKIEKLAHEKNILLSCEIPDNDLTIFIDYTRVKEAIEHILSNAIKFTHKNGKIMVFVKKCPKNEVTPLAVVEIRIQDTGIGIDPANHMRIFEPFYQVDSSSTRSADGIGMGLALARGIIEGHGGEIFVESRLDKGSTFVIILPVTCGK
ncbi:MAG: ATP-binding protein [Candidatus Desantisbacteria bacterium]